ncbi:N-acetyltransferase [Nonomuraea mesophila]|uniref:N-acetyltransferase n=1 Tax=Nonomuraea mesophila TaxID=2530382 RepID=A0A4R5FT81_9ACTN|nr:GNAT family N-acetyltransferase [Nonomuraea mesophila]TDE56714.1 N-acetyltransferase [Nonomuraea mesophila]
MTGRATPPDGPASGLGRERAAAGDAEERAAVRVLTAAFADDAVIRWLNPQVSARMFAFVVAESAAAGGLEVQDETAAAVWLPWSAGGSTPGPATSGPPPELPVRLRQYVELTAARHPSDHDHLYLQFLGVHPACQGKGAGSALLARGLARADAAGLPAYLEASGQANQRLYERHGFVPHGDPILLPDGPAVRPMWREPGIIPDQPRQ